MSRYHDAARGTQEPEPDIGRCHAYGCPLPGSISDSTKGGGQRFCRFHFGADSTKWPEITSGIRQRARDGVAT